MLIRYHFTAASSLEKYASFAQIHMAVNIHTQNVLMNLHGDKTTRCAATIKCNFNKKN